MRIATTMATVAMTLAVAMGASQGTEPRPREAPYHSYQGGKERIALTVYLRRMHARNTPYTSFMGRQTRSALKAK